MTIPSNAMFILYIILLCRVCICQWVWRTWTSGNSLQRKTTMQTGWVLACCSSLKVVETSLADMWCYHQCPGSHILVDETALSAGQLNQDGLKNLTTLGNVIQWQKLNYDFLFHTTEFHTDLVSKCRHIITNYAWLYCMVLKSALLMHTCTL